MGNEEKMKIRQYNSENYTTPEEDEEKPERYKFLDLVCPTCGNIIDTAYAYHNDVPEQELLEEATEKGLKFDDTEGMKNVVIEFMYDHRIKVERGILGNIAERAYSDHKCRGSK